jgi:hypothetical protein
MMPEVPMSLGLSQRSLTGLLTGHRIQTRHTLTEHHAKAVEFRTT